MTPAQRLRDAARELREKAEGAPVETRTSGLTKGVWLNAAHYLTTTPARELAVAEWLEHEAEACGLNRTPFVEDGHRRAHAVADAILGSPGE